MCADTGRPSHPAKAAALGARVYLASVFTIPADLESDTEGLRGYAARHSMSVVFSNYGGPSGGLPSGGSSAIWSETGELLVQLEPSGAGVAVATQADSGWCSKKIMIAGP